MTAHLWTIALSFLAGMPFGGAAVVLMGLLKSAKKADAQLDHVEPGDWKDGEGE